MSKNGWTTADLPRFDGRTVLVTGANSGLGLETTKALAGAGARVVAAVRDEERARRAFAGLGGEIEPRRLDLADLGSVRAFAEGWDGDLAVLVNNAGIMAVPEGRTVDGFERQLGTNHLGHFALTNLLLPHVTDRVVTVSSGMHRSGRIDLDDLNWERRDYDAWPAYGQSKLANLLFTMELDRRLRDARSPVRALAAHPGYASTNLQSHTGNRLQHLGMKIGNRLIAQSDAAGALPTLFAAAVDLPGGSYAGPDGFQEGRGTPVLVGRSGRASDPATAKALWTASEELTGIGFPALATA